MDINKLKLNLISAGEKAVEQLIKIAEEKILSVGSEDQLAADRLKNAAATKKLAIFDAFEILARIEEERRNLSGEVKVVKEKTKGFAESRSK